MMRIATENIVVFQLKNRGPCKNNILCHSELVSESKKALLYAIADPEINSG